MPGAAVSFGGDDRLVSGYMESEFLAGSPGGSGSSRAAPRCWSAARGRRRRRRRSTCPGLLSPTLADLAGSNLLLVPLDRRGEWYRHHHLFRDMLLAELKAPGARPDARPSAPRRRLVLAERPARGGAGVLNGGWGRAAAGLVESLWMPTLRRGRVTTLQQWFRWLEDRDGIGGHPMVTVLASLLSALTGSAG